MKWFGESWGAPMCEPETHVETPVGQSCDWCGEEILDADAGVTMAVLRLTSMPEVPPVNYHKNCHLRSVVGSVGHQRGHVCTNPDAEHDPPGMTPRQAADAAVDMFYARNDPLSACDDDD